MNTNNVNEAIKRIMVINWKPNYSCRYFHHDLFFEYLRRMAKWIKALDYYEKWPFVNLANCVKHNLQIEESIIQILEQHWEKSQISLSSLNREICISFVYWEMLKEQSSIIDRFNLPAPYEPLIILYERGGTFTTEHGFFDVSGIGIPKLNWQRAYELPEIDITPETLNKRDRDRQL